MSVLFRFLVLFATLSSVSGAPFRNLGFDDADTNSASIAFFQGFLYGGGPTSDLLPGWELFEATNRVLEIQFNGQAPDLNYVSLITTGNPPHGSFSVDGPYALKINRENDSKGYTLAQTGDVPADAKLLSYKFQFDGCGIRANGEVLQPVEPFASQASQPGATNYFDISKYAGQSVRFEFTPYINSPWGPGGVGYLDSIAFAGGAPPPILYIRQEGTNVIMSWNGDASTQLVTSSSVVGPWENVSNASSPYAVP